MTYIVISNANYYALPGTEDWVHVGSDYDAARLAFRNAKGDSVTLIGIEGGDYVTLDER